MAVEPGFPRVVIRTVVAGFVVASMTVVGVQRAPSAAAYTARAADMNICGGWCHRPGEPNYRSMYGWQFLEASVDNESGLWQVSAQEVCASQFFYMTAHFVGFHGQFFED